MKKLAVIYHSAHGHTEHIARRVAEGASGVPGTDVLVVEAGRLADSPQDLIGFDGYIFGSPTYLGGVSGQFKSFMDATGGLWRSQSLKGKLACGFTVSSLPAGDKQSTLQSMFVFAMQHGMIWVGNPIMPEQQSGVPYEEAANRLGSWSGMMAQAGHASPADSFAPGDIKTARMFGRNFAQALHRMGTPRMDGRIDSSAEIEAGRLPRPGSLSEPLRTRRAAPSASTS
jgi:NAD(P)H dehydrogenase (quinone)